MSSVKCQCQKMNTVKCEKTKINQNAKKRLFESINEKVDEMVWLTAKIEADRLGIDMPVPNPRDKGVAEDKKNRVV